MLRFKDCYIFICMNCSTFSFDSAGEQQCRSVLTLFGPPEGVPGSAGEPGAAGPCILPTRERAVQPDHHVRAGIFTQHAEETGSAGGCGWA